jgi:hypothetical protein
VITPEELWDEALLHCERAQAAESTEAARRLAIAALYYATYHFTGRAVGLVARNHARAVRALLGPA